MSYLVFRSSGSIFSFNVALYKNPKIIVLDESTNSLDSNTEQAIFNEVNFLKGKKTIIMIAHRLSTLTSCEKIYKLTTNGLKIEN